jgi:hypothetical protein
VTVDRPQINRPARAASRAEHVEPRRPCDQRGPDRRRPPQVPAGGQLPIPAFDDGLRLGARGSIGNLPLGIGGNVQAPRPNAHAAVLPESRRATIAPPDVAERHQQLAIGAELDHGGALAVPNPVVGRRGDRREGSQDRDRCPHPRRGEDRRRRRSPTR